MFPQLMSNVSSLFVLLQVLNPRRGMKCISAFIFAIDWLIPIILQLVGFLV